MTNKFQNPKTKTITIIAAVFLVGVLIGVAGSVKANVFEDFYSRFLKPIFQPEATSTPVQEQSQPTASEIYSPTVDYEQAVIRAVEQASPAVVSIIISKYVPIIEQCPYNPFSDLPEEFQQFFGSEFPEFYAPCEKGTKLQEVGGGSGFIVTNDGMIVTNKHVVSDSSASYTVFTNDGKKYDAEVLAKHPSLDLAIIKINASGLKTVKLGSSSNLKLGQSVIAIGNALGEFRDTVSVGVISGLARNVVASGAGLSEKLENLIQTDAAINQGNSGGPLLNLKGEVIGINVAMVSGAQSIGFAIPISQVEKAVESVKTSGKISVPFLGVRYLIINEEIAKAQNLPVNYGALISGGEEKPAVIKNSAAEKAGLKAEDIILELNGEKITEQNSLGLLIQKHSVAETIILKVLRDNKKIEIKATLEERPKEL